MSNTVKRYELSIWSEGEDSDTVADGAMELSKNGDYVTFEDYQNLESNAAQDAKLIFEKLQSALRERDSLRESLENVIRYGDGHEEKCPDFGVKADIKYGTELCDCGYHQAIDSARKILSTTKQPLENNP